MQMFNLDEVMEINVLIAPEGLSRGVEGRVRRLLADRHAGKEDFTLTTQTAMLEAFDNIMNVITTAVVAIAAISLLVGCDRHPGHDVDRVNERVHEIGLMRALGATGAQVQRLFLLEAIILTLLGGVLGVVAGLAVADFLRVMVPGLPVYTPPRYVIAALLVSLVTGLLSGVVPARRAASLHPVEALRAE